MVKLLTTREERRLKLAALLSTGKGWKSWEELSDELACSRRVLEEDAIYFKENITIFHIQRSDQGLRLSYALNKGLKNLKHLLLNESVAFRLLETAFLKEGHNICQLGEELFMSESSVYRMIHKINQETASYQFEISTRPFSITGDEEKIRSFFYQYFIEKYTLGSWPFEQIEEQALEDYIAFIIKFRLGPVYHDFAYLNRLKIVTAVNLTRYRNRHQAGSLVHIEEFLSQAGDLKPHLKTINALGSALNIPLKKESLKELFSPYFAQGMAPSFEVLKERAEKNPQLAKSVNKIESMLTKLSKEYDIPVVNKEKTILAFHNDIHLNYLEPQFDYMTYSYQQFVMNNMKERFPDFFNSLYQSAKELREFLNKPLHEVGIHFYMFALFMHWEGLLAELYHKAYKIKAVIISNRYVSHARMIEDFICYEFSDYIDIDIYEGLHVDREILENIDADILISNFSLPDLESKPAICLSDVPTQTDFKKLQLEFNKIWDGQLPSNGRKELDRV